MVPSCGDAWVPSSGRFLFQAWARFAVVPCQGRKHPELKYSSSPDDRKLKYVVGEKHPELKP